MEVLVCQVCLCEFNDVSCTTDTKCQNCTECAIHAWNRSSGGQYCAILTYKVSQMTISINHLQARSVSVVPAFITQDKPTVIHIKNASRLCIDSLMQILMPNLACFLTSQVIIMYFAANWVLLFLCLIHGASRHQKPPNE